MVYEGKLLTSKKTRSSCRTGRTSIREYMHHPGRGHGRRVVRFATLLFERQFRFPATHFLELPAGKIDPGEVPLATARRELLEETGYSRGVAPPRDPVPGVGYTE